ncbi:MAG: serine protease, partial [Treponema sp.]|nr:serine protease [Treponema sp.]
MKKITKLFAGAMLALMIGGTAFGQSALSIVEALQTTFRSVSDTMLPSVVEVDITQTKTYTNPLGNMTNPFEWFF